MQNFRTSVRNILLSLFICGVLVVMVMTFLQNSATIIWQIRWYPLYLVSVFLVTVGLFGWTITSGSYRQIRFSLPGLFIAFLALGYVGSAYTGPFPERTLIYSFPVLAALSFGSLLASSISLNDLKHLFLSPMFQRVLCAFVILFCAGSLFQFVSKDVIPFFSNARTLDQAANGGLYDLIVQEGLSNVRNVYSFGHQNYLSGFLLLLLPLLLYGIVRPAGSEIRILSSVGLMVGVITLFSTQSRNALLGMTVALCVTVWWSRPSRSRLLGSIAGIGAIFFGLCLLIPRFRMLLSISSGRKGMWQAAWMTGKRYFPFGSGEGLTPEMIQLFSPDLAAIWENSIQFHHTWLHIWAVGGLFSFLGIVGLTVWLGIKVLRPGKVSAEIRMLSTPPVMALSATFMVFWADYQLDILPIALLLFFQIAIFVALLDSDKPTSSSSPVLWGTPAVCIPLVCFGISATRIPSSVASRKAVDLAGLAAEEGRISDAVPAYLNAFESVKEPYALNMAATLLSRSPETQADAVRLFEQSLDLWEAQTLAHEFLVFLCMQEAEREEDNPEKQAALEKALHHAERRAEMAPQLRGSFLDQALILTRLNRPEAEIIDELYKELLMQGDLLFKPIWQGVGELRFYQTKVMRRLFEHPATDLPALEHRIKAWRRVAQLAQMAPDAYSMSEEIQLHKQGPGTWRFLHEVCHADAEPKPESLKRLLIYVLRIPISEETPEVFLQQMEGTESCSAGILNFGQAILKPSSFGGVGISARHPYSIPVLRPTLYPQVFGSNFLPIPYHRNLPF